MAKQKDIQSRIITAKVSDLKENPDNPRTITGDALEKLKASIREFPAMLQLRPIVVDADMVVLGGNMRLRACKELGITDVPIIQADTLTDKEKDRFIIADNVAFGEWDFEALANDWDVDELEAWGVDSPEFEEVKEVDYSSKNKELNTDDFDDTMELKFKLSRDEYLEVQERLNVVCAKQNVETKEAALLELFLFYERHGA
jgi:hypothetical protein